MSIPFLTIQNAITAASARGGSCISTDLPLGGASRLRWRCARDHEWEATLYNVRHGRWCPACAGKARVTMDAVSAAAAARGGSCLSAGLANNRSKVDLECAKGHRWSARVDGLLRGSWCATCAAKR